ncbi:MAG: hypothetical protein GY750_11340 [Lentisphaerae bacterium]|nr:hypothetical protein [Lentisphaerota bacterium]MCP4102007.1 hypothetical protein [Lentisphaerota bacterium]
MNKRKFFKIFGIIAVVIIVALVTPFIVGKICLGMKILFLEKQGFPTTHQQAEKLFNKNIPDSENAAILIEKACKEFKLPTSKTEHFLPFSHYKTKLSFMQKLPPQTIDAIEKLTKQNSKCLKYLNESLSLSKMQLNRSYKFSDKLFNLLTARNMARFLKDKNLLDASLNEHEKSLQNIKAMFNLGDYSGSTNSVIGSLVEIACNTMALKATQLNLSKVNFNDKTLLEISNAIQKAEKDLKKNQKKALLAVPLCCIQMTNFKILYEVSDSLFAPLGPKKFLKPFIYYCSGINSFDVIKVLGYTQTAIKCSGKDYYQIRTQIERTKQNSNSLPRIFFLSKNNDYDNYFKKLNINIATLRCAQAAIAVKRYQLAKKKPPESLSILVPKYLEKVPTDPFNGTPIKYKIGKIDYSFTEVYPADKTGFDMKKNKVKKQWQGYKIYGIGEDLEDNGGTFGEQEDNKGKDITFTVITGK